MADQQATFAGLLRELRTRARLTQQELAEAAGVSLRTVSDLERGVAATPQRETVRLLADALGLIGAERGGSRRPRGAVRWPGGAGAAARRRRCGRCRATWPRSPGGQRELEQLATAAAAAGGVVGIHAIGGMAGVGKTAFAVHAAHQLAGRFPGGQIFLPLHGHTPGQAPVDPADALASLLLAVGVPAGADPAGPGGAGGAVAGPAGGPAAAAGAGRRGGQRAGPAAAARRRAAAWSWSPAAGTCPRWTTPRRSAWTPCRPGEAAALLVRLAGRPGLSPGDPAVGEITRLCGYLPLAIGMVARQLRHHPAWTAAGRAAELASARDRLELMDDREPVGGGRVRPVLRRPHRGPAAAVPPARAAPRRRHRRLRRRRPGRHRPGRGPPRPGGPVRPVPADRAGPGPVPAARPDPRARPRPGRPR